MGPSCRVLMVVVTVWGLVAGYTGTVWADTDQNVGVLVAIHGDVEILHPGDKAFRAAKLNEAVLVKDRIRTGFASLAKILYLETDKANFSIRTPTATMGVRGSDGVMIWDDVCSEGYQLQGNAEFRCRAPQRTLPLRAGVWARSCPDVCDGPFLLTDAQKKKLLGYFSPPPERGALKEEWEQKGVTQGQYASVLGEKLGLCDGTDPVACSKALEEVGVEPPGGWQHDDSITVLAENSFIEIEAYERRQRSRIYSMIRLLMEGKLRFMVTKYLDQPLSDADVTSIAEDVCLAARDGKVPIMPRLAVLLAIQSLEPDAGTIAKVERHRLVGPSLFHEFTDGAKLTYEDLRRPWSRQVRSFWMSTRHRDIYLTTFARFGCYFPPTVVTGGDRGVVASPNQ